MPATEEISDELRWLSPPERATWVRLLAVLGLLPNLLDAQLRRSAGLTNFDYTCLAMLSEQPERVQSMSELAVRTSSSLARLSHVVRRLQERGLVTRGQSETDGRVTIVTLTDEGYDLVVASAPEHVEHVRQLVFDALSREQVAQLGSICDALLTRLDPDGRIVGAAEATRVGDR